MAAAAAQPFSDGCHARRDGIANDWHLHDRGRLIFSGATGDNNKTGRAGPTAQCPEDLLGDEVTQRHQYRQGRKAAPGNFAVGGQLNSGS